MTAATALAQAAASIWAASFCLVLLHKQILVAKRLPLARYVWDVAVLFKDESADDGGARSLEHRNGQAGWVEIVISRSGDSLLEEYHCIDRPHAIC